MTIRQCTPRNASEPSHLTEFQKCTKRSLESTGGPSVPIQRRCEETYRQLHDLIVDRLLLRHLPSLVSTHLNLTVINTYLVNEDRFLKLINELNDR